METLRSSERRTRARAVVFALAVLAPAAIWASGCAPDDEPTPVSTPSSVVVQGGKPGEPLETVAPEDYDSAVARAPHNEADAEFVTMMIGHHSQALEMSALAPDRAESQQVTTFARRIHVAQDAEITMMSTWLADHDLPVPADGATGESDDAGDGEGPRAPEGHDHAAEDMPGMLTAAELTELEGTDGTAFDRLFLESMIRHHEGALTMCTDVLAEGSDERIAEIATDMAADQAAEIRRMQQLLDALP